MENYEFMDLIILVEWMGKMNYNYCSKNKLKRKWKGKFNSLNLVNYLKLAGEMKIYLEFLEQQYFNI